MSKIDLIRSEMMQAMKNKQKERKDSLSMLLSALKAKAIDKRADLTEDEENEIVLKEIKQAQETIETTPSDRTEIINEAKIRIEIYKEFAPAQMSDEEIRGTVKSVIESLGISDPAAKDKGVIMKNLMPLVKGKADGAIVNKIVAEFIS